jgi:glycosyltransferase involved in cell wall biosynthesis
MADSYFCQNSVKLVPHRAPIGIWYPKLAKVRHKYHILISRNEAMSTHDSSPKLSPGDTFLQKIVICIPAYNEAESVAKIVERAKKYASEVIVYDDGSEDNTGQIAKASGATVLHGSRNKGYGAALCTLFRTARKINADIMVTLDSDGQHDPDQIPGVLEPLIKGHCDIVIGSRFINPENKLKVPKYRSFGIRTITRVTCAASYSNITDAQSGFRAYNKKALTEIDIFEEGMEVSTEILLRAKEKNLRIAEVPIRVNYGLLNTSTHNPLIHGLKLILHVIQYVSLRHPLLFYGLPGIVLLLAASFFTSNALELFSQTRYVSTNMILVAIGLALIGVILLATGAIVYTLIALFKGKIKEM